MSLTSVGFNPTLQTCNAFDHAFPVKAKGWGVVSWDCDLIWDDEFKTSCVRIRRNASMTPYGGDEPVREGLEVLLYLNRENAPQTDLETALIRACREFNPAHWEKTPYIGRGDNDTSFPGDRYTIVWG